MNTQEIIQTTEQYYLPVFSRNQIVLDHGKGCKVYDKDGKEYLDFLAGIAVNALGHAHPALIEAITSQAKKLIHCSNLYYTEEQALLVKQLAKVSGFPRSFLCNSGAEANEGAIKLARKAGKQKSPSKFKIISAIHSFHGRTLTTLTATGQPKYQQGYEPLPTGFEYVEFGNLQALEKMMDNDVCAVLLEPIQGEGGVHVPTDEYLQQVRLLCDKYEALLIFDEIQTGLCRTGKWFAWQHSNVKPDIMTLAKALGGGLPIGAFLVAEKLAHVLAPGDHGSTFGGNPLACAAANATLKVMQETELSKHVVEIGDYLKQGLLKLQHKFPSKIKEVRGRGLLIGLELTAAGGTLVASCLEKGVIINCTAGNVIRLAPPLIVTKEESEQLLVVLEQALVEF
ncbi:MAG TPA: acetylornithine transaminase [Candidatus Avacidaminococcus intestinavium]|uniref:Acetylornithine aminotransferase n=1 Tax=Candidatus Avacidaminococcus intestinavium TaxID=2840684 RepID=A0A9D1MNN4_9FIRM|nr:acetylornithine transaminase [Candidatus Avacidaminococcus intestinavium]